MLRYFWTYEDVLPKDAPSIALFGPVHLAWLCGIALAVILLCRWYGGINEKRRRAVGIAMGWTMLAGKAFELSVITVHGFMSTWYLPLQLCDLAIFVCLLHAYFGTDFLGQVLYSLCLPGACLALLFPDWTAYPALNYESIFSFMVHGTIVAYAVMQLTSERVKPDMRKIWKPVVFLCIVVPPIYFLNKLWDTNFFFVNWPSEGSPLMLLWQLGGKMGYLPLYALAAFIALVIMYFPFAARSVGSRYIAKGERKT